MKSIFGSIMLFITATIWGVAFVAQSVGMDYVGPFTFNFSRFFLGALVLLPFVLIELSNRKKEIKRDKNAQVFSIKTTLWAGIVCGILLFTASILQQYGINYADNVGKCGFITALYIIMVPVAGLILGKKCRGIIWISVLLAIVGMFFLCIDLKAGFKVEFADLLVLIAAVFFSIHILFVDSIIKKTNGVMLSCIQFFVCFILGIVFAFIFEKPSIASLLRGWIPICYAGIFSCGIAYTFQILGQKYVEPAKASLIMCLESAISAVAGWLILGQVLSLKELLGCVVVFAGIILAQFSTE